MPPNTRKCHLTKRRLLCLLTITTLATVSTMVSFSPDYYHSQTNTAKDGPPLEPSAPLQTTTLPPLVPADELSFTPRDEAALPVLVRPGEPPLTHADFLRCLADRLNVDVAARTQGSLVAEDTTPLIVFPMMMEVNDHRQLMCNMTNTIRYVMYVDNGGVPEVGRFLDDIVNTFGWTGRVVVRRYPWNAGFSGAVNNAIDWMLQLPEHEVPFIHVSNNDVRYPPGLYPRRIRDMHEAIKIDVQRIRELEEEVAREDADPATWAHYRSGRALRGTWSPNATLVTSRLLPDRIRYMPHGVRKTQFQQHTGTLYFHTYTATNSFLLSRLAALTVGYWDENFYPAYFEDIDYKWRYELLGFRAGTMPASSKDSEVITHYHNAVIRTEKQMRATGVFKASNTSQGEGQQGGAAAGAVGAGGVADTPVSPRVVQLMQRFGVIVRHIRGAHIYAVSKWDTENFWFSQGTQRNVEPFRPSTRRNLASFRLDKMLGRHMRLPGLHRWMEELHNDYEDIPLDVWVRDVKFREAIQQASMQQDLEGVNGPGQPEVKYDLSLVVGILVERNRTAAPGLFFLLSASQTHARRSCG